MIRLLPKTGTRLPWRPWDEFDARLRKFMEDFEEDFESRFGRTVEWSPAIELIEKDDEFLLTAEVPGLSPENVDIDVEEDVLTIRGEKKEEWEEKKPRYHIWERSYGKFQRSFTLPRSVDPEKIEAEFKNGLLSVRLPKTMEAKARKVEIAAK